MAGSSFITSDEDEQRGRDEPGAQQRHVHAREHVEAVGAETARRVVELARDAQEARLDRAPGEGEEANEVGVEESDHGAGEQQSRARTRSVDAGASSQPSGTITATATTEPGRP